jgi:hypothetical protein
MVKKMILGFVAILILIQFIIPAKNNSNDQTHHLTTLYPVPEGLKTLFSTACYDCHSNHSEYPWYIRIQPIAWWMDHHIVEGKGRLNFSTFATYPIAKQMHKLEDMIKFIKNKAMPLPSYSWMGLHQDALLTDVQRKMIIDWAQVQIDSIKARYPADSLVYVKDPNEEEDDD